MPGRVSAQAVFFLNQDCLVGATYKKSGKRDKDGQEFYDYELSSSVRHKHETIRMPIFAAIYSRPASLQRCSILQDVTFLVSVSLKSGKVYALFVKAPVKVKKRSYT